METNGALSLHEVYLVVPSWFLLIILNLIVSFSPTSYLFVLQLLNSLFYQFGCFFLCLIVAGLHLVVLILDFHNLLLPHWSLRTVETSLLLHPVRDFQPIHLLPLPLTLLHLLDHLVVLHFLDSSLGFAVVLFFLYSKSRQPSLHEVQLVVRLL